MTNIHIGLLIDSYYFKLIRGGLKTIEFRKFLFNLDEGFIDKNPRGNVRIFLFCSKKKIPLGCFDSPLKNFKKLPILELEKLKDKAYTSDDFFFKYFKDVSFGYALEINNFYCFESLIDIDIKDDRFVEEIFQKSLFF